jgi:hypothetical protein
MDDTKTAETKNSPQSFYQKGKLQKFLSSFFRELLAIFVWGYAITKLFIFDIDIFVIGTFSPKYMWVVQYKFFILIGIAAIIWLTTKNVQIILWSLFILFYPLIIFIWKIPVLIYKIGNWNLAFAYIDSIVSFIKSFKVSFIITSFFLVSAVLTLATANKILLWFSTITAFLILLIVYLQRISLAIKPSGIYQTYVTFFNRTGKGVRDIYGQAILDENSMKLPVERMEEKQIEKWTTNLQQLVLFNRLCLFVAKGLKSYRESGISLISLIISILFLALYTIFSFALINFGLYKINSNFYFFTHTPTFFTFFYYSFNLLLLNSVQEITAASPFSQTILMIESFYGLFLVAIFISLTLSVKSQKYTDELNEVIKNLAEEGRRIEQHIKEQYDLDSISAALEALQKVKASIIDWLYTLTKTIG